MNDPFDIPNTPATQPTGLVETLRLACEEAVAVQKAIEQAEASLSALTKRLHALRSVKIPDLMAEAGIGDVFSIASGHTIKISQFVSGSIPKEEERRRVAMLVLAQHGGDALIKTEVSMAFPKGESDQAFALAAWLKLEGYAPSVKLDVNAMSLQAFAREKLREGEDLPLETLGLISGNIAKITAPKEKK